MVIYERAPKWLARAVGVVKTCKKTHTLMATVNSFCLNMIRRVAPNIVIVALGGTHPTSAWLGPMCTQRTIDGLYLKATVSMLPELLRGAYYDWCEEDVLMLAVGFRRGARIQRGPERTIHQRCLHRRHMELKRDVFAQEVLAD